MDAYIVIGDQHSYKSSVLRSLSGSRKYGVRPCVILPNPVQDVYVRLSSLQEANGFLPAAFVARVSASGATSALFALRPKSRGAFPNADAYVHYFINTAGWTIQRVAIMNSVVNPLATPLPVACLGYFALGAPPVAVNQVASGVRAHFNWL